MKNNEINSFRNKMKNNQFIFFLQVLQIATPLGMTTPQSMHRFTIFILISGILNFLGAGIFNFQLIF